MTTDIETLRTLLARVESGSGEDRELDADLEVALNPDRANAVFARPLTTSLDAATALSERVFPGCWWHIERDHVYDRGTLRERYVGRLRRARDSYLHVTTSDTPARALVAAVIRAKIAKREDG